MKKLFALSLLCFLCLSGNCFAVTFSQIELVSINSEAGDWSLSTDVILQNYVSPTVTYAVGGGAANEMTMTPIFGTFFIYLDDVTARLGGGLSDYLGSSFKWMVDDTTNDLSAEGTISGIRQVPVSTDLAITGDPLNPTLSWLNSDAALDDYRVRVFDSSYVLQHQWYISAADSSYTFTDYNFLPERDYIIRVEARDMETFSLSGDFASCSVLNRSIAEILYTVPAPVPEPATMLLLGSGLISIAVFRRRAKTEERSI